MGKLHTTIVLIFLVFMGYSQNTINLNQNSVDSYQELSKQEALEINSFAPIKRARLLDFNEALENLSEKHVGNQLNLNLFSNKSYTADIKKVYTDINGTKVILSKLDGFNFAYSIITISEDATVINIDIPENHEIYSVGKHAQSSNTFLVQFDEQNLDIIEGGASIIDEKPNLPQTLEPNQTYDYTQERRSGTLSNNKSLGVNDEATIDVMIVYTPAASSWLTSNGGSAANTVAAEIAKANLASDNSGLGITFNLVHSYEVSYTEVDASSDLDALRTDGDGIIDDVHTNRDQYAADIVPMLTLENNTGGLGALLMNKYGNPANPFSINRVQQLSYTYTMIHEMGHNMGAHHHKDQTTQPGPTTWNDWPENTWSAGWRWTGDDANHYCDLMTYSSGDYFADGTDHTRIAYFSNPNYNYQGQPVGDAADGDNARTLREVKHYVAQYKDAGTLLYCSAEGSDANYTSYNINNVTMGDINQASSYSIYSDFSFNSTDVTVGESTNITVSLDNGDYNLNKVLIWVDWNDDKDFDDTGEDVYVSSVSNSTQFVTGITPPQGTSAGTKRMRIRHILNGYGDETACGNGQYGEVEDYTLNVIAADIATTKLTDAVCGSTVNTTNTWITCDTVQDAEDYEFLFENTGASFSESRTSTSVWGNGNGNSNTIRLYNIPNIQYGLTYDVKVRAKVGGVWGEYGTVCQYTLAVGGTKLIDSQCGTTFTQTSTIIYADVVQNVEDYEFFFSNTAQGISETRTSSSVWGVGNGNRRYFRLSYIPNLEYGLTYDVQVRAKVDGVWGDYGQTCQLTLTAGQTKLRDDFCDATIPNTSTIIYADYVSGATDYEFKFVNDGIGFNNTRTTSSVWGGNGSRRYFRAYYGGLQYGLVYEVQVRAKVGGVWGDYGQSCQLSIGNISRNAEIDNSDSFVNFDNVKLESYPNPFNTNTSIFVNGDDDLNFNMRVFDISGKEIFQQNIVSNKRYIIGEDFTKGIYFVSVTNNLGFNEKIKIVKTR